MTLKQYSDKLATLAKEYQNAIVVFASDEEGNSFHELSFNPTLGDFAGCDFISDDGTEEFKESYSVNAVCLN